jgi:hypothetical protein
MSDRPAFPAPSVNMRGRWYWRNRAIREYEQACVAHTTGTRLTPLPMQPDDDAMMSAAQLAARYGVHRRTIARWCREDRSPGELAPEAA